VDVNTVLKIVGIGVLVSVACQVLTRAGHDEQASLVSLAGVVVVLIMLTERIGSLISMVRSVFGI
jgi:stage III sporulation protein AC